MNLPHISHRLRALRSLAAAGMLLLIPALSGPTASAAGRGEKSFGPRIGYVSKNDAVAAGLVFQYSFTRSLRVAPEIDIVFRNEGMDAIGVGCNVQFPMSLGVDRMIVYPFVGPEYMSWNLHSIDEHEEKDVTTHKNRLGANAGVGFELRCTSSLKLSLEGRYTAMKHYSTCAVFAGIAFVF